MSQKLLPVNQLPYEPEMDENDPKYRCCCNTIHVQVGVKLIAFAGLFFVLLDLIEYLVYRDILNFLEAYFMPFVIEMVTCTLCYLCLLYATKKKNKFLLLPYVVHEAFTLLGMAVVFVTSCVGFMVADRIAEIIEQQNVKDLNGITVVEIRIICILINVLLMVLAVPTVWFLAVVTQYYIYLTDKYEGRRAQDSREEPPNMIVVCC